MAGSTALSLPQNDLVDALSSRVDLFTYTRNAAGEVVLTPDETENTSGLRVGDVLLEADRTRVTPEMSPEDGASALALGVTGSVRLLVRGTDGQTFRIEITVPARAPLSIKVSRRPRAS